MYWGLAAAFAAIIFGVRRWRGRARRPAEAGCPYVHINLDGSARELSPGERRWVESAHEPTDGARPSYLHCHESRDGYGLRGGLMLRRKLPPKVKVAEVHPEYDARMVDLRARADERFDGTAEEEASLLKSLGPIARWRTRWTNRGTRWRRLVRAEIRIRQRREELARAGGRPPKAPR